MNLLNRLTLAAILFLPATGYTVGQDLAVNQDMINVAAAIQLYKKECPGAIPDEMEARYGLVAKVAGPEAVSAAFKRLDANRMAAGNVAFCALIKTRLGLN
jgi:hypothetical protein